MYRILFVCHGNICRSPMAEFIMRDLVTHAGLGGKFHIASAATSREELGNPVYPPARRKLAEHGISCAGKTARQLTQEDYSQYNLLIGMDRTNLRQRKNSTCCWSLRVVLERASRTPGIQATLRAPSGTF
mgnify:CR=1 FL=1